VFLAERGERNKDTREEELERKTMRHFVEFSTKK